MKKILIAILLSLSVICLTGASNITVEWTVPAFFEKPYQQAWDSLNYDLVHTNAKIIILDWQGYGGWSDIGDRTIRAMEEAKKQGKIIILHLIGDAISMHASVACHASKIEWGNSYLIFHSGFLRNKEGSKDYSNEDHYFQYCVSEGPVKGVLTKQDIDAIINDRQRVEVSPNHHQTLPDYP